MTAVTVAVRPLDSLMAFLRAVRDGRLDLPTRNGTPCILDMVWASTRYSARRMRLSWPRLISGTSTWL